MSELKAISGHEIREDIDYNTRGIDPEDKEWCKYGKELCDTLYYRKSEADKVIARHKYKRCLAMVNMCERKRVDAANYRIPREKWEFYEKWHKRWLELAEKFKETK